MHGCRSSIKVARKRGLARLPSSVSEVIHPNQSSLLCFNLYCRAVFIQTIIRLVLAEQR